MNNKINTKIKENAEVFQVYPLEEDSMRYLCHKTLTEYLDKTPTAEDIEQEWNNIQQLLGKEIIFTRRRDLRI